MKKYRKRKYRALRGILFSVFCCCLVVFIAHLLQRNSLASGYSLPNTSIESGDEIEIDFSHSEQRKNVEPVPAIDTNIGVDEALWYLILVNRWNPIPEDYGVELTELRNGQRVDKRIYPALQEMFDAARSEGVYPVVASGFRTAKAQQKLLDEKIAEYRAEDCSLKEAKAKAEAWVALPGTSEHQIGIAVDINGDGINSAGAQVYEWLAQNAHKYGFICRYPAHKTEITGVMGEAWHYRYVGTAAAGEIYNRGLCLEEYLLNEEAQNI